MGLIQSSDKNMETLTKTSDSAAAGPHWLLLNCHNDDDSDSSAGDAKTTAASCTSSGLPFTVSFSVATPPACSSIHGRWVGGCGGTSSSDDDKRYSNSHVHSDGEDYSGYCYGMADRKDPQLRVIAAHDDAVLTEITFPGSDSYSNNMFEIDHFLYDAGGGRRPPSLSLLPGCYVLLQLGRC